MEMAYFIYSPKDSECVEQIWASELHYKNTPYLGAAFLKLENPRQKGLIWFSTLTLYASTPQNGQTYSNNSLAKADKLFECV